MITAKSSFNMRRFLPAYKNLLKRNRGSALFYGALCFLFFSLQYIMSIIEYNKHISDSYNSWELMGPAQVYNGFSITFFTMISLVIPIIVATNIFSYMQNKRSVDVYHSLPLTRDELYSVHCAVGLTVIWVPLIINFGLVAICSTFSPVKNMGMILLELACWLAITFVIFVITAFAAVEVGTVFDTAIFSIGLNGAFSAVYVVIMMLSATFLYGFNATERLAMIAYKLSPVSLIIGRQIIDITEVGGAKYFSENNISIAIWTVAAILLYFLGMFLYRKRQSEQAEAVGNMGPLQIFLRSAGTLVGGTMLGAMFCAIFNIESSKPAVLISMAVGSVIVYFIGDVILTRTVRSIPKALPAALITSAGVVVVVAGIMFGGMGYETRVPIAADVSSITLNYYSGRYNNQSTLDTRERGEYVFKNPEAIELIIKAHNQQVASYAADEKRDNPEFDTGLYRTGTMHINYELANGSTASRAYYTLYPQAADTLVSLECIPEFVMQEHPVFLTQGSMIDDIVVYNALGSNKKELSLNLAQKDRLIEALQKDLLAQTEAEIRETTQALGYITFDIEYLRQDSAIVPLLAEREAAKPTTEKDYDDTRIASTEIMITESYSNTRALLAELDAADALQNDFTKVKKSYVGIIGWQISNGGETVCQTNREGTHSLTSDIFDAYYDDEKEIYVKDEYANSERDNPYIEITSAQLMSLRGNLTNIMTVYGEPHVVVAIPTNNGDGFEIGGYYFAPLSALGDSLKTAVFEQAKNEYSKDEIVGMGYACFE